MHPRFSFGFFIIIIIIIIIIIFFLYAFYLYTCEFGNYSFFKTFSIVFDRILYKQSFSREGESMH